MRRRRDRQPTLWPAHRNVCSLFGFVYLRAVKIISWNVNGLRAVLKKNFLEFIDAEKPDILCLQETKCTPEDVEQLWPATYTTYWNLINSISNTSMP